MSSEKKAKKGRTSEEEIDVSVEATTTKHPWVYYEKYCEKCRKPIFPDSKFCQNCGSPVK